MQYLLNASRKFHDKIEALTVNVWGELPPSTLGGWRTRNQWSTSHLYILFFVTRLPYSVPADVLWGSFVTWRIHSPHPPYVGEKWIRDKRTPKEVCGEAIYYSDLILHPCSNKRLLSNEHPTSNMFLLTWATIPSARSRNVRYFLWSSLLSGPRDHYSPLSRPLGVLRISSDGDVLWWKDCFGFENFDSGILIFMGRKIWQVFFGGWLDLSRDFWESVFALIRQSPSLKIRSTPSPWNRVWWIIV